MSMHLSPLNFSGLLANARAAEDPSLRERRIEAITVYRCPDCYSDYEFETDAELCCEPERDDGRSTACPVCNAHWDDYHHAVDCCLWKDIDGPSRWRIAEAMEAGSTWADQLGVRP